MLKKVILTQNVAQTVEKKQDQEEIIVVVVVVVLAEIGVQENYFPLNALIVIKKLKCHLSHQVIDRSTVATVLILTNRL